MCLARSIARVLLGVSGEPGGLSLFFTISIAITGTNPYHRWIGFSGHIRERDPLSASRELDPEPVISDRKIAGFHSRVVEYAMSVTDGRDRSREDLTAYGHRQVDHQIEPAISVQSESQEDRDIDVATQGSRDGHVEFQDLRLIGLRFKQSKMNGTEQGEAGEKHRIKAQTCFELENEHLPGSQRAAVDRAVAEALSETGVVIEADILTTASQEFRKSRR